jgi:curved DNA-binding protein CbpA
MPEPTFRGDPYAVLDVPSDATTSDIKRRWRQLAREHHPDRASDPADASRLTGHMARINAAYEVLGDPVRRARYDSSPAARRARGVWERARARSDRDADTFDDERRGRQAGPPAPPPTRPVTARFDTSAAFHGRNTTTSRGPTPLTGHPPVGRRGRTGDGPELRASMPTGPVRRGTVAAPPLTPSLAEAAATELSFGKFRGMTLGEIADLEPTYIDWIARTITRDRDLVVRARVVGADLDQRGISRTVRPARAGFGSGGREPEVEDQRAREPAAAAG